MRIRATVLPLTMFVALSVWHWQWIAACGIRSDELGNIGMWWQIVTASLVLAAPGALMKRMWVECVVIAVAYMVMIANLLYLRTFGSWIPWGAYCAVGNLADFTDAVVESFRISDVLVPLILLSGLLIAGRCPGPRPTLKYLTLYGVAMIVAASATVFCFGFEKPLHEKLDELSRDHRQHALAASRYSLPVVTIHEAMAVPLLTDANRDAVEGLLSRRVTDKNLSRFNNLVVIFMESLEGWPVGLTVDGREVTPVMNSLMADTANLGVGHLKRDTGPGRSIDAQLVLLTGLIPTTDRIFSFSYPGNNYPSVYHAFKQKHPDAKVRSFTTDHDGIYNLGKIAPRLGVDSLYCWPGALTRNNKEGRPSRKRRMSDGDFFNRVMMEIDSGGLWHVDEAKVLQLVTYTCHAPYKRVEGMGVFPMPAEWPRELRSYLNVVHYSDSVLGRFVDWLKSKPDFDRTVVAIMGDHPTFGSDLRAALCSYVPGIEKESVPGLILNGGRANRIGDTRQADLYPTMITLLGLGDYNWHGVGVPLSGNVVPRPETPRKLSTLILNYNLYSSQ